MSCIRFCQDDSWHSLCGGGPPDIACKYEGGPQHTRVQPANCLWSQPPRSSDCPPTSPQGLACLLRLILDVVGPGKCLTRITLRYLGTSTVLFSFVNRKLPGFLFLVKIVRFASLAFTEVLVFNTQPLYCRVSLGVDTITIQLHKKVIYYATTIAVSIALCGQPLYVHATNLVSLLATRYNILVLVCCTNKPHCACCPPHSLNPFIIELKDVLSHSLCQ